jgi:hypothetical protein
MHRVYCSIGCSDVKGCHAETVRDLHCGTRLQQIQHRSCRVTCIDRDQHTGTDRPQGTQQVQTGKGDIADLQRGNCLYDCRAEASVLWGVTSQKYNDRAPTTAGCNDIACCTQNPNIANTVIPAVVAEAAAQCSGRFPKVSGIRKLAPASYKNPTTSAAYCVSRHA